MWFPHASAVFPFLCLLSHEIRRGSPLLPGSKQLGERPLEFPPGVPEVPGAVYLFRM